MCTAMSSGRNRRWCGCGASPRADDDEDDAGAEDEVTVTCGSEVWAAEDAIILFYSQLLLLHSEGWNEEATDPVLSTRS